MEIILIRHADPNYKKDTITARGIVEAKAFASSLKRKYKYIDGLYVSPLGRAQDTQRYIAEILKVSSITLEWLREIEVVYNRCSPWERPGYDYLARNYLASPDSWWKEFPPGEILRPYFSIISKGFDHLMESYGYQKFGNLYLIKKQNNKRIILVSHKGTILTLLAYLLHWPLPLIYIHGEINATGVTRLFWKRVTRKYATPKLIVVNDCSHLNGS